MTTVTQPVETRTSRVTAVKAFYVRKQAQIASLFAFLGAVLLGSPAHAATTGGSLLGGAETTYFDSIKGYLTGNLLPLVFVLAAVVVGAGMLIRYGRKAVSS